MSEQAQRLPNVCESAEEKSLEYDRSKSVNISKRHTSSTATTGTDELTTLTNVTHQSFDDSVFLTLPISEKNRNILENPVVEDDITQETSITTLNTVQVHITEDKSNLNAAEGQNFLAQISTSDLSTKQSNVLASTIRDSSTRTIANEIPEVQSKQRKLSNQVITTEVTFSDPKERELYLKIATMNELPITCRKNHAFLYKDKLGSGRRGRCIKFGDEWYTPSEFEISSGLEMSKDWKRSLRYGGRSLLNLINRGFLRPHAATCTCAICSEDSTVTGPVLYYTPKIRRKRGATASLSTAPISLVHDSFRPSTAPPTKQQFAIPTPQTQFEDCQDLSSELSSNIVDVLKSTNLPFTQETKRLFKALADNEQEDRKVWSKLEKKAESMVSKLGKIQESILKAKKESEDRRERILKEIYSILRNQNIPLYIPDQPSAHFGKTLNDGDDKLCEEVQDEEEEEEAEICRACGNPANSECTGCRKATYCSTECQEMDWNRGHRDVCRTLGNQRSSTPDSILPS